MWNRLRLRFQNHHDQDALTHLEQAGIRSSFAAKAIEAGMRPIALLRLVLRHGHRCSGVMEELLDELNAAQQRPV